MTKTEFIRILTSFSNKLAVKIEDLFVKKEAGKGLSTNDFTDVLKAKLDDLDPSSGVVVDSELNADSTNPVQNKTIVSALNNKANADDFTKVENKSSEMIRSELTSDNVTDALGYKPAAEMEEITDVEIDAIIAGTFTE